ncbi:sodium:solute symporter family protein [Salibacter sp.]|uniref:sodium:solute symporter family protein n=1 Tax=Salibacter sp. TaxID=2010995 RepID=UPI00286FDAC0|nr:sodium:solute symporter family protein [Salibacter sp.]MDR9398099.1 sodium:solute symporter family protein [Salibacter sp.]MDR9487277.1 sodium:solute symporter family protein [Salibacter sp.]
MHWIDLTIFITYMVVMLGVGFFFMRKNKSEDDYYVGGRSMGSWHIGLSVVATDVGGGFSIGLGGLGFVMGVSGSWMLFTGLIGAWLSGAFLIPKVAKLSKKVKLLTFPQIFNQFYGPEVALLAGLISAIGYLGFTSSQILAGAKLASASFVNLGLTEALIIMGVIAVVYTVLGGLKAVIYTDTVQWAILMIGLIFIGLPLAYNAIGGIPAIKASVGPEFLSLTNISWSQLVNWAITIIPIWFVGMTLYQRMYAAKGEKEAKKAWFIAGILEWPIMAMMGVLLGLFARVAFDQGMFGELGFPVGSDLDSEMGLPLLLRTVLPVGLMGIMMSAYFSAIMSTADSCLMAASGNIVSDLLSKIVNLKENQVVRISQVITLIIGAAAILIALNLQNVLDLMLLSYSFMVSGLLVPVIGAFFWKKRSTIGAVSAMLGGGLTTVFLNAFEVNLPFGLDANFFGILASAVLFISLSNLFPNKRTVIDHHEEVKN